MRTDTKAKHKNSRGKNVPVKNDRNFPEFTALQLAFLFEIIVVHPTSLFSSYSL